MSGHGPQLLYSLPCYTPRSQTTFHSPRSANYVVKPQVQNPLVLQAQLPYDRNWGRSDWNPWVWGAAPVRIADDPDIPANPFAQPLQSEYRYLPYSAPDKMISPYRYDHSTAQRIAK
jgi:hypothetical protein